MLSILKAQPLATPSQGVRRNVSCVQLQQRSQGSRVVTLAGSSSMPVPEDQPSSSAPAATEKKGIMVRVKEFFMGDPNEKNKLAALGMAAFMSYGVVSNLTYGFCLSFSWITFVKTKGISPLAPGQWPVFLAFYAGIWTVQNFVRPARFALAVAMAPVFDRAMNRLASTLRVDKKVAFALMLLAMALCTTVGMFGSIYLFGGLPDGFGPLPPLKR